jgi:ABC-type branched-subunit amino acid transport system ATPase component
LLEIKGLYGGYEKGVNILQGIDLTVEQGEAVGIIGLNGSGKSTFGKAIMNLLPYRRGKILFEGQHIEDKTPHELAQMGIAMMHQGGTVFPNLSVWENLQLAIGSSQISDFRLSEGHSQDTSFQLSDVIPLLRKSKDELANIKADKLSGGQRHELALAMTLARQPHLLILDEPSAGLSPVAVEKMYVMLEKTRVFFGVTILVIEQNVSRAVNFTKKCVILNQGKIDCSFSKDDALSISEIESLIFKK